ncbi:hypothetical protein GCM10009827_002440 [Dactylosporangium maewongense]|uniref:Knr4/Smi1-like domain-containing protein n=1 Tax=Dactylosporangium maewongense TaxID=634393 RepID=A0ABN1ZI95_9ACTN
MDDIAGWKAAVRREIAALSADFEQRFGYPFDEGGNYVAEPEPSTVDAEFSATLPSSLRDFYAEIGEVCLIDFGNGYRIYPVTRIAVPGDWALPTLVRPAEVGHVVTFGSTGGGQQYSMARETGQIFYLPPGLVEDGIHSSSFEQPRLVASDLQGFLRRLLVAVRAFVATGDPVDV